MSFYLWCWCIFGVSVVLVVVVVVVVAVAVAVAVGVGVGVVVGVGVGVGVVVVVVGHIVTTWLWVKKGYPKNPVGKRKNRPKPAVRKGFRFDPKPHILI